MRILLIRDNCLSQPDQASHSSKRPALSLFTLILNMSVCVTQEYRQEFEPIVTKAFNPDHFNLDQKITDAKTTWQLYWATYDSLRRQSEDLRNDQATRELYALHMIPFRATAVAAKTEYERLHKIRHELQKK